jgi:hypothetical protein
MKKEISIQTNTKKHEGMKKNENQNLPLSAVGGLPPRRGGQSSSSFKFGFDGGGAGFVDVNSDHIGPATNDAVLYELLLASRGGVDKDLVGFSAARARVREVAVSSTLF